VAAPNSAASKKNTSTIEIPDSSQLALILKKKPPVSSTSITTATTSSDAVSSISYLHQILPIFKFAERQHSFRSMEIGISSCALQRSVSGSREKMNKGDAALFYSGKHQRALESIAELLITAYNTVDEPSKIEIISTLKGIAFFFPHLKAMNSFLDVVNSRDKTRHLARHIKVTKLTDHNDQNDLDTIREPAKLIVAWNEALEAAGVSSSAFGMHPITTSVLKQVCNGICSVITYYTRDLRPGAKVMSSRFLGDIVEQVINMMRHYFFNVGAFTSLRAGVAENGLGVRFQLRGERYAAKLIYESSKPKSETIKEKKLMRVVIEESGNEKGNHEAMSMNIIEATEEGEEDSEIIQRKVTKVIKKTKRSAIFK